MADPPLRPMGFGEILDAAFTLYRRHFGTLFLTALLPNVPIAVYWIYIGGTMGAGDPNQTSALLGVTTLLLVPYSIFAAVLVWAALVHDSSQAFTGRPATIGKGYRHALRRFFPLLGAFIVAGTLTMLGFFLFIVPGILLMIVFFAVSHAVVIEGEGPLSALGRSRELARDGWRRIFGIVLITVLIVSLPGAALGGGLGFLAALIPESAASLSSGPLNAAMQGLNVVVSALTTPYMIASLVVLYYDRRVRTEALDLELATEQINPAL